ncbi:uncharacterized protein [Bemisia tabaci]|uniref:uncharacterized protein isoform X1 n=1 Tax=Bemisia tabaci TaxID=7038 RepID=UPI003B285963
MSPTILEYSAPAIFVRLVKLSGQSSFSDSVVSAFSLASGNWITYRWCVEVTVTLLISHGDFQKSKVSQSNF